MSDNKETPKQRRPLPTPGAPPAQRPNTPVQSTSSGVPPAQFYATTSSKASALPPRSLDVGSSHTAYVPPDPPPYTASPGFREPELIDEESMFQASSLSLPTWDAKTERLETIDPTWTEAGWGPAGVYDSLSAWSGDAGAGSYPVSGGMDYTSPGKAVAIDGRDNFEEMNWWNPTVRQAHGRPGLGMLPPRLAEELHDPEHSLFSVTATAPDIKPPSHTQPEPPASATPSQPSAWATVSQGALNAQPTQTPQSHSQASHSVPTEDDVRTAIPHPNAYYCPRENGWVILLWKSSSLPPPLAESFLQSPHHSPFPDQTTRKRTTSCLATDEQPFGQANKTHHFHKYAKAVDAHKLSPPLRRDEWDLEPLKQRRRAATIVSTDIDLEKIKTEDTHLMEQEESTDDGEGRLLDLYVCCQCSFYCIASGVLPGVVPRKCMDELARERRTNPPPGRSGEQSLYIAFETILKAIENKLWRGENRLLSVGRPSFRDKVGWNANVKRIFEILGFKEDKREDGHAVVALAPPSTDISTPQGRQNRKKLIRAWVEIGAWIVDFKRIYSAQLRDLHKQHPLHVQIHSAREMYQTAIGAHPDQIPRGELKEPLLSSLQPLRRAWEGLGLTVMSYSADLLAFGYYAQCRCDPAGTIDYFTYFSSITQIMQDLGSCPPSLLDILATERSRDRYTREDFARATVVLGFGPEGTLGVDYDETDIPEEFIESAWKECVKKSWKDAERGSELLRDANEAFRIVAESRGSIALRKTWEAGKDRLMNPDRAYLTLEVPKEVDDSMLLTVYSMRMEEPAAQVDSMRVKMHEALLVIAEARNSDRLRRFLETGQDPGEVTAPTRPDFPRGLNQLGNTCYLNSLLQYFYTIKDLREAVMGMYKFDLKSLEDEKLTDDDIKRHRVGGRLVTRREIVRSKKFISQLADLFFNLEYCETPSVTPTIELAKLALVTSRDEEEDEADKGGTDSSNDTDATLVDDAPSRAAHADTLTCSPRSPSRSPSSTLGKRSRELEAQPSAMDLDGTQSRTSSEDGFVQIPSPTRSSSPPPLVEAEPDNDIQEVSRQDGDGDVAMRDSPVPPKAPPPLPPRRKAPESSNSVMMFGKQHDVAECMDNCMFQIETALLKFDESSGSSDKTSVVKGLFYGKLRQRLTGPTGQHRPQFSIHEKEDLFSHLPVNVTHEGVDLYDGLSSYFDDIVEFEGEKRRMEVTLVDLPPLLQIQLQRVQFNRETLQAYKEQAYVKFGEMLYMDRYMDNADPQKKAQAKAIQSELHACRERIRQLTDGKVGYYVSALENTGNFLSKLDIQMSDVDDDLLFNLNDEQALIKNEIDDLRKRAQELKDKLEAIWKDNTEMAYELTSVFVHRGTSPSWGHYFFYSRHLPDQPDSWFKYNDSDVTVVSKDEVLADTTGSTANPYLLVFARKGAEVVDTVKRFDPSKLDTS